MQEEIENSENSEVKIYVVIKTIRRDGCSYAEEAFYKVEDARSYADTLNATYNDKGIVFDIDEVRLV